MSSPSHRDEFWSNSTEDAGASESSKPRSSSTTRLATTLPSEIWAIILDSGNLVSRPSRTTFGSSHYQDSYKLISTCCLVNRTWCALAQPSLFRTVDLFRSNSRLRAGQLLDTCRTRPDLAAAVNDFAFANGPSWILNPEKGPLVACEPLMDNVATENTIRAILGCCGNLKSFHLNQSYGEQALQFTLDELLVDSLEDLFLSCCQITPPLLPSTRQYPNLRSLYLKECQGEEQLAALSSSLCGLTNLTAHETVFLNSTEVLRQLGPQLKHFSSDQYFFAALDMTELAHLTSITELLLEIDMDIVLDILRHLPSPEKLQVLSLAFHPHNLRVLGDHFNFVRDAAVFLGQRGKYGKLAKLELKDMCADDCEDAGAHGEERYSEIAEMCRSKGIMYTYKYANY